MALKNSTGQKVTTRELCKACDSDKQVITNELLKYSEISFRGIVDNKINVEILIDLEINGVPVRLRGNPTISLNHFELSLRKTMGSE